MRKAYEAKKAELKKKRDERQAEYDRTKGERMEAARARIDKVIEDKKAAAAAMPVPKPATPAKDVPKPATPAKDVPKKAEAPKDVPKKEEPKKEEPKEEKK